MTHLPAHEYLDKLGLPYEKASFPSDTEKGAAHVAQVLGYHERQMVKTLIFDTDRQEMLLVLIDGDQNIVSGNLKKVVGSRNTQMAQPKAVQETTGYVIGSIPPFSWQPDGFRSFIDASLMDEALLGVGAGVWGNEIIITPQNLVKARRVRVVNLVDWER